MQLHYNIVIREIVGNHQYYNMHRTCIFIQLSDHVTRDENGYKHIICGFRFND